MTAAVQEADWDLTPYFDAIDGEVYRAFRATLAADVEALQGEAGALGPLCEESRDAWAALLVRLEDAQARNRHLASYLGCRGAADARDAVVQRETASASAATAELEKVFVSVRAAVRDVEDGAFEALLDDEHLRPCRYFLERLRQRARLSMDRDQEALAAELAVTGIGAWGRLYDTVSGKLTFELAVPGRAPERLPVAATRSLLEHPDPVTRRAALEGANAAWERVSDTLAACLNAIAGTRHTLYARRGVGHFLEPAAFDSGIATSTLDAMLSTVRERFGVGRRYLRGKARCYGQERLGFQDLLAPLPSEPAGAISWDAAREQVAAAFRELSGELADFAEHAFARRWIDYRPRDGKRPGGFCSSSSVIGESRIFMTYRDTLGDVSTLAHELGHAFHSWVMRDMRPWSRRYPMTLAETASTFAEQLVTDAVLAREDVPAEARATMLDARAQDGATFLLNIPTRFDFERAFYEERREGEVGVDRLKELMLDAQRAVYGDALDPEQLDPWFWASKLHFYISGLSFYNFPYTFGYLFSMGLFARARREGPDFVPRYEALLRETGSATAEEVARNALGIELGGPEFWNESIDLVEAAVDRFEAEVVPR
ncbi:MAG: M3 family oligoendopeptidase [Myxococcota bacterium]